MSTNANINTVYGGTVVGLSLRFTSAWSGLKNCTAQTGIHEVEANGLVTYTGTQTGAPTFDGNVEGVTFIKTGANPETVTAKHAPTFDSPRSLIGYIPNWVAQPVDGDVLDMAYVIATGLYVDDEGTAMEDKTTRLVNCQDIAPIAIAGWTGNANCAP